MSELDPTPAPDPVVLPTPDPPPADPAVVAAPEPEPEPVAEPEPAPEPKKASGMLADLIEERTARKAAVERVKQFESDPAIQRLTPEVRQALVEGRIIVKPPQTNADAERDRLTAQAQRFGLFLADGSTPDLEAARRVDAAIRDTVREEVAPIKEAAQQTRVLTMQDRANKNIQDVWIKAQADGIPQEVMDIARKEFEGVMAQPNAAHMLSQVEIVDTVWERALGKAYRAGKLTGAPPKKVATPAIVAEPSGRRAPAAAAIQMPAHLEKIYREAGIDPSKTTPPTVDARGYMELKG